MLLKVVREEDVRYCAVCFDEHGPTFRHVAYADYKAGRTPTPPELVSQFKLIRELLPSWASGSIPSRATRRTTCWAPCPCKGRAWGSSPCCSPGIGTPCSWWTG